MKATLFWGDGASADASTFNPQDPQRFGVTVQLLIGAAGDERADSFELIVCSPSWLAEQTDSGAWFTHGAPLGMPESVAVGSGIWFMRRWDHTEFARAVDYLCEIYSPAPDWGTLAARLGRQLPWEFDAQHDAHINEDFGKPFPPPQ